MKGGSKQLQACPVLGPCGFFESLGWDCLTREKHSLVLASQEWGDLGDGVWSLLSLKVLGFLPCGPNCEPQA